MLKSIFTHKPYIILISLSILVCSAVSIQDVLLGEKTFGNTEVKYTHYNNYMIFKSSFPHLIQGKSLYRLYPEEHWDLFKYSPSFALSMGILYGLPDVVGLFIWNLINFLPLILGLYLLLKENLSKWWVPLLILLIEAITSLQNEQSNGLMAGLIILGFLALEKNRIWGGVLLLSLTVFIKLFGGVAFLLLLMYPWWKKTILPLLIWNLILFILPLPLIGFEELIFQYKEWWILLTNDHAASYGISILGVLSSLGIGDKLKLILPMVGLFILCFPLWKRKSFFNHTLYRMLFLASVLIWMVIFNHKAESPTYVICVSGIIIWFFISDRNKWHTILLIATILLTILSPTDLFPKYIRETYIVPYNLKAVPCIFIWFTLSIDLILKLFIKPTRK